MKKWGIVLAVLVLLSGCAVEETFETVSDEMVAQVSAQQRQMYVELPGDTASPAVESDASRLYLCGDYEICIQVLEGGDREATVKTLTGFSQQDLTVMETQHDSIPCLEFAWASAGESGDLVGRGMVLDDGNYHYCLTVLAPADTAEQNRGAWDLMFASFRLV